MHLIPGLNSHLHNSLLGSHYCPFFAQEENEQKLTQLRELELFPMSRLFPAKSSFQRWVLLPLSAPLPTGDYQPLGQDTCFIQLPPVWQLAGTGKVILPFQLGPTSAKPILCNKDIRF